jgi:hypothetical protein
MRRLPRPRSRPAPIRLGLRADLQTLKLAGGDETGSAPPGFRLSRGT